ncbi:MAG: hypothetical protein ACJAYJ_003754 [Saprospiraceae bacterium]|jgi:hypothetical protein
MALLCFLFTDVLSAQTTFNNTSGDQDWFNAINWDNGLPANGNNPTIPAGFTANFNPIADYILDFDVANMGTLNINLSNFNINNGGAVSQTLTNAGDLNIIGDGTGIFINDGNVINTATGEITNDAVFINDVAGSIGNENLITNLNLLNHFGSISSTNGEIINAQCANFRANDASMGSTMPTFTNNGVTYILGSATLVITTNNGVVLTDGAATPMPTPVCINMPLEIDLDANGMASITPADIDDGSTADYCPIPANGLVLSQTDYNCTSIGDNTVALTVFDGLGNSAQCMATVTVNDPNGPTITCPNSQTFTLVPGACEMSINFAPPTVMDNCPGFTIMQTDATNLSSGDDFPRGTTTLTFEVTDSANNTDNCSFDITLNEFDPGTTALACDQSVQISLDVNCVAIVTPAAALEGNYGCYDDFTVNVNSSGTNMVNMSNLGQTVTITVTNNISGNSCWGFGTVEEKLPPQIVIACQDTILNCLQNTAPISEGGEVTPPTFSDCSSFNVSYFDTETAGGCNDPFMKEITRTWTAVDIFGETNFCTQVITVEKVSLDNDPISCPANYELECVLGQTPDFSPEITGYPTINISGTDYEITTDATQICSVGASFTDGQPIDKCGVGFLIIRTWTIVDWCVDFNTPNNPIQCIQQLKFVDHTAPIITQPGDLTVSTNQTTCFSIEALPAVLVSDCSDFDVVISTPVGAISGNGGNIPFPGLALGTYTITYIATDECSNSSQVSLQLTVEDDVNPQMICDTYTTVSLDNTGFVTAQASVFDDGSTDNCCILTMTARRLNNNCNIPNQLDFNSEITFCCADVGTNQMIEFRIDDCSGNFNSCMVEVEVQDPNQPTITCPSNITIECEADPSNFAVVGQVVNDAAAQTAIDGLANDVCENLTITNADNSNLNCGTGTIARTWTATDMDGNATHCFHIITVQNSNPFDENDIDWPADTTYPNCDELPSSTITGEPEITIPNDCADIFISFSDQILNPVSANYCKKILRIWTVIDWCQYVPNSGSNDGRFTYEQVIFLEDSEGPIIGGCEDLEICNFKADCSEVGVVLAITALDNCTANVDLNFSWIVDLNNDGVADNGANTSGIGLNIDNEYPNGEHRITYTVEDHCGNAETCSFIFTIEDCKKPTPFCNGTTTTIMQGGNIAITINQFIEPSSNDNCTAFDDLEFSFSPDINDNVRNLDCDNLGENVFQIWVTDEVGNNDFCEIIVNLQDNSGSCNPTPLVALGGQIFIEDNEGVEDVMVEIMSNSLMNQTNDDGDYMFDDLTSNVDYTVTPSLNNDAVNGVTTLDLAIVQKHILNIQNIDSPYKLIAADANNSGSITTLDLLTIRKVILQIIPNFTNNTSWRFVDAAYEFPNPLDPFLTTFPEFYFTGNLDTDDMQGNFVAIKIGDVNQTAIVNSLQSADDRNEETMTVTTEDQKIKIGELVGLDISSQTLKGMLGYQFTLNFDTDALEFVNIQPGTLGSTDNFGLALLDEGAITTSWDYLSAGQANNAFTTPNTKLFRVLFRARTDGTLSDWVHLNSRFTFAESYTAAGTPQDVELVFTAPNGTTVASENFELYQNLPNPFREMTTIGFHLPEATNATLTIFDVTGKTLKTIAADYDKGYHQIDISKSDLSQIGVLYYRLETSSQTATKKMLFIH